jgi:aldehyde dehydrogenase (NAD+)
MITKREFYIDGKWVAPLEARDCPVIDPSTEEACAVISLGSEVAAAKAAFPGWAATPPAERRRLVEGILEQYNLRKEEMAQAISIEMGAPIDMARNDQAECLPWHLKNFLKAFDHMEWVRPLGPHAPDTMIALELADEPGDAEGDPGAAGRLHLRAEAVGGVAAVLDALCRILP